MWTDKVHAVLNNPVTAICVALGLAALAASGKISMNISNLLLIAAFLVGCFGIHRAGYGVHFTIIFCLLLGIALTLTSWWLKPSKPTPRPTAEEIASGQLYKKRAEIYEQFMQEKTRRVNIFSEGAVLNMRITGLLGQLKVPSLRNNPVIYQELNQELNKRIEESEKINKESGIEDESYIKLIASIQIYFPDSPTVEKLIKTTMRPIIITIPEARALNGEAVQIWYKEQGDSISKQLDDKVKKPLDDVAKYLKDNIK